MGEKSRFLAILAALLAAAFRVTSVSPESKGTERHSIPAKAAEAKGTPADALLRTFSDFDKGTVYVSPLGKDGACSGAPVNSSSRSLDWAIATVPDPERSNLKLDFDRELEAIQNAAESAGYQIERFWFPWGSEHTA